jgi:Ca-activated chloride channel family protein
MKWIKFSKYTGDDFGIDANDLMQALADFFLQSGFNDPYMQFQEWNQQTLEDLKRAIQEALESGRLFPDDQMQQMLEKLASMSPEQMDQLLENFVQKLAEEGHISTEQEAEDARVRGEGRAETGRRGSK